MESWLMYNGKVRVVVVEVEIVEIGQVRGIEK